MIFGVPQKLKLSENALTVIERRYLQKDESGKPIEKPIDMFKRVASTIVETEKKYKLPKEEIIEWEKKFLEIMISLEFLPNSPTFTGAGTKLGQLSACFVLPIEDSMEGIFDSIKNTALIHKSGGGTGFSFSRLRPKNDPVKSTSGSASGPISFMTVFNQATETIKQGGTRRGANMGILRVDHPDIMDFIDAKKENDQLNNFNLSIAVSDKFMKALEEDGAYDLIHPATKKKVDTLKAKEVWQKIIANAWRNGDPGVVFIDSINKYNPTPHIGDIESTNPCGEQPLLPYESCNLGSINLAKFYKDGRIDFDHLKEVTRIATRFLDDVIDANKYPLEEIRQMSRANRKIGLGVMGWADLLIDLGVPYDSQEALDLADKVMKIIAEESDKMSVELAKEKGVFPNFEGSTYDTPDSEGIRNATRTTIAPTGTLSIVGDCSSGIEPIYALCFIRKSHIGKKGDDWVELLNVNPYFEKVAKEKGFYSKELMKKIAEKGSMQEFGEIPASVKRVFVTAHDISPEWHVKMQAVFQKYVNNAVSKTINFPNSASKHDVEKAYKLSYKLGCKGITIYRDGSREVQVLTTGKEQSKQKEPASMELTPRERPIAMRGTTYKIKTSYGDLYVVINDDEDGKPFEVFATIGKAGGFFAAKAEAICRLISLALRSGIPAKEVIKQIKGIRGPLPSWSESGMILSLPDAISQMLEKHIARDQSKLELEYKPAPTEAQANPNGNLSGDIADYGMAPECPDCGNILEIGEGCLKCRFCGFSKCS